MRVENVDHHEDRELRRDRAAVLQMLLDCQQQHLIAEGIVIARTAGGKENRRGPLFLCSAECPQHLRRPSADGDADRRTALIKQNRVHFHDVNIGNCFNIHARKHKPQLHLLRRKSRASQTVNIHPTLRNVARGQIRFVGIMNKKICYRPFQGSERGIDRFNNRNNRFFKVFHGT